MKIHDRLIVAAVLVVVGMLFVLLPGEISDFVEALRSAE